MSDGRNLRVRPAHGPVRSTDGVYRQRSRTGVQVTGAVR